jgi:diguanylate cyclase (GGDEF)-like protein
MLFRADERTRTRVRAVAFTASAWLVSATFAATYLAAGPVLGSSQILKLTMVSTAVCAIATISMSALLTSYLGYIGIQLGAVIVLLVEHPDPELGWKMPLMVVALVIALVVIAARTNRILREKVQLGLQLRDSALRDGLTGLPNRRFVTEVMSRMSAQILGEWQVGMGRRRVAQKRSLALFLVDLDHFKAINDTYGHAAGDSVLMAFAQVAQSALRSSDIVARWGGEEFLVVAETRDRESTLTIGERLRGKLAAHRTIDAKGVTLSVTCSTGACLFPFDEDRPDALTWEETVDLADRALYQAKRAGRNRTLWVRPGTAGLSPREGLMASRETLDPRFEIVSP